jgi:hypothetical protein
MADKMTKFEAQVTVVIFADSQGDAVMEIERRLTGDKPPGRDQYALIVQDTHCRRVRETR